MSNGRYDGCICEFDGGIVRFKRAHKQAIHILPTFWKRPRCDGSAGAGLQASEPDRLGGGRGRVNPPPRRLVWRFWEVWRVWNLVSASTRLEARGLGGFLDFEAENEK